MYFGVLRFYTKQTTLVQWSTTTIRKFKNHLAYIDKYSVSKKEPSVHTSRFYSLRFQ